MSNKWSADLGRGARIEIDRDAFSDILFARFEGNINVAAGTVAQTAKAQLPEKPMQDRIRVKTVADTPSEWQVASRSEFVGGRNGLLRGMRIPVALVTSDSNYSYEWEYGALPNVRKHKQNPRWQQQYRPLTTAIQQSKWRDLEKFRKPRRTR